MKLSLQETPEQLPGIKALRVLFTDGRSATLPEADGFEYVIHRVPEELETGDWVELIKEEIRDLMCSWVIGMPGYESGTYEDALEFAENLLDWVKQQGDDYA